MIAERVLNGTWEDILKEAESLVGRRVQVVVMAETNGAEINRPEPKDSRPLSAKLAEIAARFPEEELAKIPADLSYNLDHYLYGAQRKEL